MLQFPFCFFLKYVLIDIKDHLNNCFSRAHYGVCHDKTKLDSRGQSEGEHLNAALLSPPFPLLVFL